MSKYTILTKECMAKCKSCNREVSYRPQTNGLYYLDEISLCCDNPDYHFIYE